MRKVVIAMDSFKGCLSSIEAERAAEEGVRRICPDCETLCLPMTDGGEGMLDVWVEAIGGTYRKARAHDPLMRPMEARYGVSADGRTALIEMAEVNGLPLLSPDERNPMRTTTYGTGELIADALERGCRRFVIGVGGSATNDAGLGMLQALGVRLQGGDGHLLGQGGEVMGKVASVDCSGMRPELKDARFTVICDVRSPFCGPQGAAYVFAPQKGADEAMVAELDEGMRSVAQVIAATTGRDIARVPGAGAAGGLGAAFLAFLNAELRPGIDSLLQAVDFSRRIAGADLVITGEGRTDRQTLMGKVPFGVLTEARKRGVPVMVVSGGVECTDELNEAGFAGVFSIISSPVSLAEAMRPESARENIKWTVSQVISLANSLLK